MRRVKSRAAAILILTLCILLSACTGTKHDPLGYQDADFTAEIDCTAGKAQFSAVYTKDAGGQTMRFTAPENLAGISARRTPDGQITLEKDGLSFTASPGASGLFAAAALFEIPRGCLIEKQMRDGLSVLSGRYGKDSYSLSLDSAGRPVRIEGVVGGVDLALDVKKFSIIENG